MTGAAGTLIPAKVRGYHVTYRENDTNWCPGCGRSHWYVGRVTAECAFCGTALPMPATSLCGGVIRLRRHRRG